MPDFYFTDPQGNTHKISGPEGSTPEQALAKLQEHTGPTGGAVPAAIGGFIKGTPIAGPALFEATQRAAARTRSLITGQPFSEELPKAREYAERTEKAHPVAEGIGEVAGGLTGTVAASMAAPEVMGMTGTLPRMMAMGGLSQGAISAADALARGDNPWLQGGIGGLTGAAGPLVGRGVSAATAPVVRTMRGIYDPAAEAARRTAGAISRDIRIRQGMTQAAGQGLTGPQFAAGKAAGQPVMAMDVGGETTRALARSAANTSPEGRAVLDEAINQRYEQQGSRFTQWLRSTFHYPNAQQQQEALDIVERKVNAEAYRTAYARGDENLLAKSQLLLDFSQTDAGRVAMAAADKARNDEAFVRGYRGSHQEYNLQFWDLVRRKISDASKTAPPDEAARLGAMAKQLNSELDRLVPTYRQARAGAAQFFGAENALEAGQKSVTSKMKNDEIRAGLDKMTPLEKQLFQDGYVDRAIAMIRESPDRREAVNQLTGSQAARERLELAVGPEKAKELQAFVHIENVMDFARRAVQGNSTTARQLVELGLAGGAAAGYDKYTGTPLASPESVLNAALVYGAARGHRAIDERVSAQVARLLASDDISQLRRAMTVVAHNPTFFKGIENADAAIGSIITRGTVPQTVGVTTRSPQKQPEPVYAGPMQ